MLIGVSGTYYGNLVVAGLAVGAVYALFGLGITLIYKATKVPNFAHAAIGMVGAYVFFKTWDHATVEQGHRLMHPGLSEKIPFTHLGGTWTPPQLPLALSLILALLVVSVLGLVIERVIIRPLGSAPTLTMIIVTVAMLALIIGMAGDLFGQQQEIVDPLFGRSILRVGGLSVEVNKVGIFAVTVGLAALLTVFFRYTTLGVAVRATADSKEVSRLLGISANRVAGFSWAVGSMLAAIAGILISPDVGLSSFGLATLVVFGFAASLVGGFTSLIGTLIGGLVVGVVSHVIVGVPWPKGVLSDTFATNGATTFVTFVLIVGILMLRPRFIFKGIRVDEDTGVSFARTAKGLEPEDQIRRRLDHAGALGFLLSDWTTGRWLYAAGLVGALVIIPLVTTAYWSTVLGFGLIFAMVALSIIVLTGWTGQLSLAPFTFLGVGAYCCAIATSSWHFPALLAIPVSGLVTIPFAIIIGLPALRLRGFFLALSTLAFAAAGSDWLFTQPSLTARDHVSGGLLGGSTKYVYFAALVASGLLLLVARNLERSRVARAFFALRDSEITAVSMGIDPVRYKLLAFSLAGFIGGVSGSLLGFLNPTVQPIDFVFDLSLSWVLYTVVSSVITLPGALLAGFSFSVVPQLLAAPTNGVNQGPVIIGALTAILTVMSYPNGLAMFYKRLMRRFDPGERIAWASAEGETQEATVGTRPTPDLRPEPAPVLSGAGDHVG